MLKKNLHKKVTNLDLNEIYDTAIQAGAMGGKLLGAGEVVLLFLLNQNFITKSK